VCNYLRGTSAAPQDKSVHLQFLSIRLWLPLVKEDRAQLIVRRLQEVNACMP